MVCLVPIGYQITSDVSFVLITGNPGGWKSTVSKLLFCGLGEEWRLFTLDDFLYLRSTDQGDFWTTYEASYPVRANALSFYGQRHAKVIAEGIVQSDRELGAYCKSMNLDPDSSKFRFFDLRCSEAEAVIRMSRRPIKEDGLTDHAAHYRGLSSRLRARGAIRLGTDGSTPGSVADAIVKIVNGSRPDTSE